MDKGAWWATVHGVAKNQTWLSMLACSSENSLEFFPTSCGEVQTTGTQGERCWHPAGVLKTTWSPLPPLLLFTHPVVSDSLWPHGLQQAMPPCPSPSPGICLTSCGAIQPSHPQMPSSPSALNLSQHQGVFQWVVCLHQMTKILVLQLQYQSFQWIFRVDLP